MLCKDSFGEKKKKKGLAFENTFQEKKSPIFDKKNCQRLAIDQNNAIEKSLRIKKKVQKSVWE